MKITFNIDYQTNWGESIYLSGNIKELGENAEAAAIPMSYDAGVWRLSIEVSASQRQFTYSYFVKAGDTIIRREWGKPHVFSIGKRVRTATVIDHWMDMPADKSFYSSMFTEAVFRRIRQEEEPTDAGNLQVRVFAPTVRPGEVLAICGEGDALGNWDVDKAPRMNDANFPEWAINIPLSAIDSKLVFKFVKIDTASGVATWEYINNREYSVAATGKTSVTLLSGLRFADASSPWKGAGTAIPVFSIRTEDDFGVGDFVSIRRMVDWLAMTGQRVLQILPINDTTMTNTWQDSYPYNANSTFALHPMFLRLQELGEIADESRREYFRNLAAELNALPQVDYERVNEAKIQYAREIYAQVGEEVVATPEFAEFVEHNRFWLRDYAAFCLLRDKFGTANFSKWGEYATYNADKVEALCKENAKEINFTYYVQYNLDKQLRETRDYAHSHNVVLKGDIPIGISRTSADAWRDPDLFHMDCQAGAPPDDFSVLGQNWGFPTYDWEVMARDGYAWWKNRMVKMSEYFDLYRIDHILGFFRIWQIPMTAVHGLLGTFNPAMPYTPDELRNNYDFWIDVDTHTRPYIRDYFLYDFFGEYTQEVKEQYLNEITPGKYELKEFVDNQRKVADHFETLENSEKNTRICNALMGLLDEVLFIEDANEKGKYHPRISAQFTYSYRALNDYEKWCYDRMYNDFFYHRHNGFWYGKAMQKLPALVDSTSMLACGEDLGMIPDCVPAVMNNLQILSLEIQRMPKDPKVEFGNPHHYPYLSVCTTSTHDMGGIRAWWEENPEKSQHFYNSMLGRSGQAPYFAEPWICDIILDQHMYSPAMLTVLPWQDWMSIDADLRRENPAEEQINVPAISRHYWRYRMHMTVEQLLSADNFNRIVKDKVSHSGR
ncbi:MAG: 4-alpha-glucanotransferase [Candidatus Limisoma sp.]|nr:4-alpha-glucanotransferase [Bacteroidales bacterium]MDY5893930.1 4-alpha-glucanotransferase [Candidatus Limisoma sp.]